MKRCFLAVFMLIGALAQAQVGVYNLPEYPVFLLRYPSLLRELRLSPAVAAKIDRLRKESDKRSMGMVSVTPKSSGQARQLGLADIKAERMKSDAAMLVLLNSSQKARLKQVGYQYAGGFALSDPKTAQVLHLTPEQQGRLQLAGLKAIQLNNTQMGAFLRRGNGFQNRANLKEAMLKALTARLATRKFLDGEVAKVLNAKQSAQWKAMQGKPFPIDSLYNTGANPTRS